MNPIARLAAALVTAFALSQSARAADPLVVFAAASTFDAMEHAIADFGAGKERIRASYAASSTLARQIEAGAPAHVFVSANRRWMDYLAGLGLVGGVHRHVLARNSLVMIAPRDAAPALSIGTGFALRDALGDGRLAMGDPDHVPAGIYGRQALQGLGVWREVRDRIARAADVRGAVALVARGESPLGIAYATDALVSDRVVVIDTFPDESHDPIEYDVAALGAAPGAVALDLVAFLISPAGQTIFARHGFRPVEGD